MNTDEFIGGMFFAFAAALVLGVLGGLAMAAGYRVIGLIMGAVSLSVMACIATAVIAVTGRALIAAIRGR